jgi:LacI family transcriptional regulator
MASKRQHISIPARHVRRNVLLALNWYAPAIHRGIARYASGAGWSLDIRMLRSGVLPSSWQGSGILCVLGQSPLVDRVVLSAGVSAVNIGNQEHPLIPRVCSDNAAVGQMAAEYFLQRGFRHFAFFVIRARLLKQPASLPSKAVYGPQGKPCIA